VTTALDIIGHSIVNGVDSIAIGIEVAMVSDIINISIIINGVDSIAIHIDVATALQKALTWLQHTPLKSVLSLMALTALPHPTLLTTVFIVNDVDSIAIHIDVTMALDVSTSIVKGIDMTTALDIIDIIINGVVDMTAGFRHYWYQY